MLYKPPNAHQRALRFRPSDCHITGLPYSISFKDNVSPNGWTLSHCGNNYNYLTIKESSGYMITMGFHIPYDTNISAILSAYAYGGSIVETLGLFKPKEYFEQTIVINASNTAVSSGTSTTIKGVIELPYTASFQNISRNLVLSPSVTKVCIHSSGAKLSGSVGSGDIGLVCNSFNVNYR